METVILNIDSPMQIARIIIFAIVIYYVYQYIKYRILKEKEYREFIKEVVKCRKNSENPEPYSKEEDEKFRNWNLKDIKDARILKRRWEKSPETCL